MSVESALKHFERGCKTQAYEIGGGSGIGSKPLLAAYERIGKPHWLAPYYLDWLHYGHGSEYSGDKQKLHAKRDDFAELFYIEIAGSHKKLFAAALEALGDDAREFDINFDPTWHIGFFYFIADIVQCSRSGKDPGLQEICRRNGLGKCKLDSGRPLRRVIDLIRAIISEWDDHISKCVEND